MTLPPRAFLHTQAAQAKGLLAPPPTGEAVDADPLAPARHLMGRLNLVRSTLPYAALLPSAGPDPVPRRPAAYVVSGLQPGARASDVATAFDACQLQGVGPALRVTFMSSSSAVVETGRPAPAQTAAVPGDTEGGAPSVSAAASAAVMLDTTVNGMRIMSYGLYYSLKSEHMARIGADDVPEQPARKRPRLLFEPPPPGVPAGAEGAAAAGGGKALLAGRPGGPVAEQQEQGGVGGQGASPAAAAGGWRPCVIM